jgi:protein involved in polysaccharide export with SLBB domain
MKQMKAISMNRGGLFLLVGLALATLLGCQSARGPRFDAHATTTEKLAALTNLTTVTESNRLSLDWLNPPTNRFTLGPGDSLEIEILGDASTRATNAVGPDGKIYYYLLPGLDVWGLTLPDTRALIEHELMKYVRDQPQVSVMLHGVESRRVWLLGRLSKPGVYPMAAPMALLEALSVAGGPSSSASLASVGGGPAGAAFSMEVADLRRSFVMRNGEVLPVDFNRLLKGGDLSQNIYLQPDDFVYVPGATAREVFVLGAVLLPRPVAYRERMSLVSAIANAQGTIKNAYLSHVAVVRGSLTEPKIAVVDYKEIVNGRAPDVLLEPGDIVYVPLTPYRTLVKYADLIVRSFVQTIALNEGARAVSRNVNPVGVNIGVGGSSSGASVQP